MMNKEYWINREKEKLKANLNNFEEVNRKVKKNFDKAAKEIEDEIFKLYARYATENKLSFVEASKMLTSKEYSIWRMDLKEYVDEINESMGENTELLIELNTLSAKSQISRLEEKLYQIQKILNRDYIFKRNEIEKLLKQGVRKNFTQTAYSIDMYLGVHGAFNMISEEEVENIIKLPWSGKHYSKRLWNNRTKLKEVIEAQLTQATVQGKDLKQCAREIAETMESSKKVAERLINTEHAYACSQGDLKIYKEFDVKEYEYLATLDIKTSKTCRNLDGKKFSLSVAVPGVNFPPMHAHCRSTTVPVDVDDLEDSVRIARDENGKNIYVDSNLSYREWYKKYVETNPQYLLKEKKWKNRHSDKKLYEDYKIKYGKEIPKSFEKFQDMKYNNTNKLEEIKERHSLKKSIFSSEKSLGGHFNKHNSEFGYKNKEEYLKKSQELLGKTESENIRRYKTKSGRHVVYDKKSNEIVIYDKGKIKTYMKPNNGYEYYLEQYRKDIENE